jgi:hypothetical protein
MDNGLLYVYYLLGTPKKRHRGETRQKTKNMEK